MRGLGAVRVVAWGALAPEELASGWKARAELPERKHLKLMTRPVRLGIAAVGRAIAAAPKWVSIPPERRGLFVGARPNPVSEELSPALEVARTPDGQVDPAAFGRLGLSRLHPLWLVKGLSNNIPGYACAYWDIRGVVANRCEGRTGGLGAIVEAARAVAEGRVDIAVAGGADSLVPEAPWVRRGGEGAAFVVLSPTGPGVPIEDAWIRLGEEVEDVPEQLDGIELGAATGPLALVAALARGQAAEVVVGDSSVGLRAGIAVGAVSGESRAR